MDEHATFVQRHTEHGKKEEKGKDARTPKIGAKLSPGSPLATEKETVPPIRPPPVSSAAVLSPV